MQNPVPIALFVYNRPDHARRTLAFLKRNYLAEESRLFIFSDAARPGDEDRVEEVRDLIANVEGFKSVEVIRRSENYGLARSVIDGVSRLSKEYGKVIVLEDDVITSPHTLQYFNEGLRKYEHEERVMHISAYMYAIKQDDLPESFFLRIASSQAWATWQRAWKHFEPDIDLLMSKFNRQSRYEFEVEGAMNFWKHMEHFKAGRNNSWAIRWYASVFLQNGLSLNPRQSLIDNIGHDGSGVHSAVGEIYRSPIYPKPISQFPDKVEENKEAFAALKHFLKHRKGNYFQRGVRFLNHTLVRLRMKMKKQAGK